MRWQVKQANLSVPNSIAEFGRVEVMESNLRLLCRGFFESIGAKVSEKDGLLYITLPEDSSFDWGGTELTVGFSEDATKVSQDVLLFSPGSWLFHRVHEWLKRRVSHIAIELPEVKKPTKPNLNFRNCELVSVKKRKMKLRGLIVSVALSCTPAYSEAVLKNFMVLENGFVEDVTGKVNCILFDAKPAKFSHRRPFMDKLLKLLHDKQNDLLSDWLSKVAKVAKEWSKVELMRIANYYFNLVGDAAIKAANNRQFQQEMQRLIEERNERLEEEAKRHQPFILADVVGIAEVNIPAIEFKFTVIRKSQRFSFKAYYDLYDGALFLPRCVSCDSQMDCVNLCACGHAVCSNCVLECSVCGKAYCKDCVDGFCGICNLPVCKECSTTCEICRKRICRTHVTKCESCEGQICEMCSAKCHMCGKVVCVNDAAVCTVCGKAICNDCLQRSGEEVHKCFTCGKITCDDHKSVCSTCGQIICTNCVFVCSICGANICTMHAFRANCCSSILCSKHAHFCQLCAQITCPEHATKCGICGASVCYSCSSKCTLCEQRYCHSCLKGKTMCNLCTGLLKSPERKLPPSLLPHPMPRQTLKTKKCCFVATQYRAIYLWRDGMDGLLVVADASGKTILTKRLTILWLLRHLKKWS